MARSNLYLLLVATVCVFGCVRSDQSRVLSDVYDTIYNTLESNNVKRVAPGEIDSHYRNVTLSLDLANIVEVDTDHRSMEAVVWLMEKYTDPRLRWNPNQTGGYDRISIPRVDMWIPDWELFNGLAKVEYFGEYPAFVTSDGGVSRYPVLKVKFRCGAMTASKRVTCAFKIGSWIYSTDHLNPVLEDGRGVNLDYYETNPFWDVVDVSAVKNEFLYDPFPETYASVKYTITIEKKSQCA